MMTLKTSCLIISSSELCQTFLGFQIASRHEKVINSNAKSAKNREKSKTDTEKGKSGKRSSCVARCTSPLFLERSFPSNLLSNEFGGKRWEMNSRSRAIATQTTQSRNDIGQAQPELSGVVFLAFVRIDLSAPAPETRNGWDLAFGFSLVLMKLRQKLR